MQRIAVLTSGGDAPGMNAAIRASVRTAVERGAEVVGVRRGFSGLMNGDFLPLDARSVGGIIEFGGTILHTNRAPEFRTRDGRDRARKALERERIDGLIVIGGNGSQTGSRLLFEEGFPVNGVASTIDNDLHGSEMTIGVDTAINIALEAVDRLRTTAASHERLSIVEVMGRDCGYLALATGLAGGAEVILTPEMDLPPEEVLARIQAAYAHGKRSALIVVAEGAKTDGSVLYRFLKAHPTCQFEPRLTVLGYVQRGGKPTAFDRLLATRLAARATELLLQGDAGLLIGLHGGHATPTPFSELPPGLKPLPEELLALAKTMQG
jgi:6-phosphofructokinase 1